MSSVINAAASATSSSIIISSHCVTAIPDKNGHVPINDCRALYNYYPSFAAAILFCIIFGISFCLHTVQAIVWRKVKSFWFEILEVKLCANSKSWTVEVLLGVDYGRRLGASGVYPSHSLDTTSNKLSLI